MSIPKGRRRSRTHLDGGDDLAKVVLADAWVSCLVADGATAFGEGWKASESLGHAFATLGSERPGVADFARVLSRADWEIAAMLDGADTTGLAVALDGSRIWGACAGDSEAWLVGPEWVQVTEGQVRKPRIGSGARITTFDVALPAEGMVVLATDGLWNAVRMDRIEATVGGVRDPCRVVDALVTVACDAVPGGPEDDVTVVAVAWSP